MEDIRIRRCRLRLCRRNGWHWGPNPKQLLENATRLLPILLAQHLARILDRTLQATSIPTLRVRIPVTLDEIRQLSSPALVTAGAQSSLSPLPARLEAGLKNAFNQLSLSEPRSRDVEDRDLRLPSIFEQGSGESIQKVFRAWYDEGLLFDILETSSDWSLQVWETGLRRELASASGPAHEIPSEIAPKLVRLLESKLSCTAPFANSTRTRLALMTWLLVLHKNAISLKSLDQFVAVWLHSSTQDTALSATNKRSYSIDQAIAENRDVVDDSPIPKRLQNRVVDVASVLPFIVTGVLAKTGYLGALPAALETMGLTEFSDCFAAALAYKTGARPLHTRRHDPATDALAAVVAGTDVAPAKGRMATFLNRYGECSAPLRGVHLAHRQKLCGENACLLLDRIGVNGERIWSLTEVEGAAPLIWTSDLSDLLRAIDTFRGKLLLVNGAAAKPILMTRLCNSGHDFLSNSPLPDSTHWSRPHLKYRLWTNNAGLLNPPSAPMLVGFTQSIACVASIADGLFVNRPLLLPTGDAKASISEYEISTAVAAALAEIAMSLWGSKGATDPLTTLRLLGDLEGKVSFEESRVLVRPSLGKRYMDLYRNDLLADVPNVPWWQGRRLEFAGL